MIMVEAATEEDRKNLIQAPQLQNQGYAFQKMQGKMPKIKIFDVSSSIEKEDIPTEIYRTTAQIKEKYTEEEFTRQIKTLKNKTDPKDKYSSQWILEVTPQVRKTIKEASYAYNERFSKWWTT